MMLAGESRSTPARVGAARVRRPATWAGVSIAPSSSTPGVRTGTGTDAFTVWGCDLSDGYVRINADYTT